MDNVSEVTMSHKSKSNGFRDILDESTLDEVEDMESNASNNEDNDFHDTDNNNTQHQMFPIQEFEEENNTVYKDDREVDQDNFPSTDESINNDSSSEEERSKDSTIQLSDNNVSYKAPKGKERSDCEDCPWYNLRERRPFNYKYNFSKVQKERSNIKSTGYTTNLCFT